MSEPYWVGGAAAVAQVSSLQVTAYDAGTTYKISVGGTNGAPTVTFNVLAAGSVNATATALAAAWNASAHPYCTGVTALAATDTVTFTADVAGVPFVITKAVSGGTGTLGSVTAVTASAGPNDWSTAGNWSTAAVPVNSDTVYLRNAGIPILWGLDQSAVALAQLIIEKSFNSSAQLGLPLLTFTKSVGSTDSTVPEYRSSYLAIGISSGGPVQIGENYGGNGQMAGLVKLDLGSSNAKVMVIGTGTASDQGPAVFLRMNHASATLGVQSGKVALNWEVPGQTGQVASLTTYQGSQPAVFVGDTVTIGAMNDAAGAVVTRSLPGTLTLESGGSVTLANVAAGTITLAALRGGFKQAGASVQITSLVP